MFKFCTGCETEKPLSAFGKKRGAKDGYQNWCKDCHRNYQEAHKEEIRQHTRNYEETHKEERREEARQYRETHKEEAKEYRERHKEKAREYMRQYQETHKEEMRRNAARYQKAHKEKVREYLKRYQRNNPDVYRAAYHRRRAKKLNSGGSHTTQEIKDLFVLQDGFCYWCGCKIQNPNDKSSEGEKPHLDHVIPLDRGGSNSIENLVWSCWYCNLSKGNKLPNEWLNS